MSCLRLILFLMLGALICLMGGGPRALAGAPDPLRTVADEVNRQTAPNYGMPVTACYVNQTLQPAPGYNLITIRNSLANEGIVIRYIRSYQGYGGVAEGALRPHGDRQIYVMDARTNGEPIVRSALAWNPEARTDGRLSVLRPGESCTMWLPVPQYDGWMVVVGRVQIRSAGVFVDLLKRCIVTVAGETVDCTVRLDTINYSVPEQYGERVVRGAGRYDFDHNTHWSPRPQ